MSLYTILKIGKELRHNSKEPMQHFKYVCSPKDKENNYPLCVAIPVSKDFSIDWSKIEIVPENEQNHLYFLKYKTSDNDTSPAKYIFGDIYYKLEKTFDKKGNLKDALESGNYLLFKKNAYDNSEKLRESYLNFFIKNSTKDISKKEQNNILSELKEYIQKGTKREVVDSLIEKYPIIQFWRLFYENKDKIEKLLMYAPVYDFYPGDLEDAYIKYLFDNKYEKIKNAINEKKLDEISNEVRDNLLNFYEHDVFIHFAFADGTPWYKQSGFQVVVDMLNREIIKYQNGDSLVPASFIYRTLCSGNQKNDIQFPNFSFDNSYKSFAFKDAEQFVDFLYAASVIKTPRMWVRGTDINIFVFPSSEENQIDAEKYESFFFDKKSESSLFDFNFMDFLNDEKDKSIKFDFVLSNTGGNTTVDLIEISGIEKSQLKNIKTRLSEAEDKISKIKEKELGCTNINMKIEKSFIDISGLETIEQNRVVFKNQVKKDGKLAPYAPYQSHMLKVLPLIYTENYHQDDTLLNNVIKKTEFSVRNGEEYGNFSLLKYDLMLIYCIQNNQNDKYMQITQSESYGLGVLLGDLAKNISLEISSFEKNYVGNLTRKISTMDDFIKLKNDIEQKLIMHDKSKFTFKTSYELAQKVKEFHSQYDKEECAFGFFESYFKPITQSDSNKSENN